MGTVIRVNSTGWWGRPLSPQALVAAVGVALAVLTVAFAVESAARPEYRIAESDLRVYQPYGTRILDGQMPYRDFELEYPPAALPMFVLPATHLLARGPTASANWAPLNDDARRYNRAFGYLVLALTAVMLALVALSLAALRRPAWAVLLALAVVASSPLLFGDVFPGRFDVWPAALAAAALAAAIRGHYRVGGVLVGVGAAAKIYPALLLPVLVIVAARHRGVREAIVSASTAVAGAAAVFLPFLVASFAGTWHSLRAQLGSGLQIESLAASVLVAARHLGPNLELTNRATGGAVSRSVLVGPGVHETAAAVDVLLAVTLIWLWVSLLRSKADPREDLVRYGAAAIAAVLVLGTVLSPQYVIWLIPLVPLVGGRRGAVAMLMLVIAAALTHVWFPARYVDYENGLDAGPAALLLARNIALLATALVLIAPGRLRAARAPKATPVLR